MDLLPAIKKALKEFKNQRVRTELELGVDSIAWELWDSLGKEYEEIVRREEAERKEKS